MVTAEARQIFRHGTFHATNRRTLPGRENKIDRERVEGACLDPFSTLRRSGRRRTSGFRAARDPGE